MNPDVFDPLTVRGGEVFAPARAEAEGVVGDGLRPVAPGSDEWARWRTYLERVAPDAPSLKIMQRIDAARPAR